MINIVAELPQISNLLKKIESATNQMYASLDKIPDDELEKIIAKQERRMAVISSLMRYGHENVAGMAESGYRSIVMQDRRMAQADAKVQELLDSGMSAYEIMESGWPITDRLLLMWLEEEEGEGE